MATKKRKQKGKFSSEVSFSPTEKSRSAPGEGKKVHKERVEKGLIKALIQAGWTKIEIVSSLSRKSISSPPDRRE